MGIGAPPAFRVGVIARAVVDLDGIAGRGAVVAAQAQPDGLSFWFGQAGPPSRRRDTGLREANRGLRAIGAVLHGSQDALRLGLR